ncbi:hypothetical protein [Halapricum hydrolyticum]|uniref:Uncharacterized protein n=1 Tax=Halapricum hydrolyticum TaxID=2979991 RepID=A0AAE3I8S2_9EURY|nr:hypothetical protein [Halapricum hydrolyticum]MCU4716550.1 hypothetical protein [Halapricum hydrolyticum]MCU4725845.1 hypothetical protein [Halapricum hydrolyticum]
MGILELIIAIIRGTGITINLSGDEIFGSDESDSDDDEDEGEPGAFVITGDRRDRRDLRRRR